MTKLLNINENKKINISLKTVSFFAGNGQVGDITCQLRRNIYKCVKVATKSGTSLMENICIIQKILILKMLEHSDNNIVRYLTCEKK